MFTVREYESNNYLSKGEDSQIVEVEDIGNTVAYAPDLQENSTTITSAEIIAVPELDKYKGCLRCKARVEPLDLGLGRCSKEDRQMLQNHVKSEMLSNRHTHTHTHTHRHTHRHTDQLYCNPRCACTPRVN